MIAIAAVVFSAPAFGQGYPKVPPEVTAANAAESAANNRRSDEAFARALPEIEAWAAKGKPYLPGAAKPEDLPQAKIPAFPGAWGGGMYSFGGRGGKVIVVTNLDDSGPGSFRAACEAAGPRIVVFNVAGIIRLEDRVSIRAPYITLAGNTAPGDGVCIAGDTVEINTHDVVVRHLRFRRGKTDAADRDDSLGGNPVGNLIIDHVSASWSLDENISMYRHMHEQRVIARYRFRGRDTDAADPDYSLGGNPVANLITDPLPTSSSRDENTTLYRDIPQTRLLKLPTVNITIQNSISSESLNIYHHAFGSTIGGHNSTFHHNLWANNTGRNPSVGMNGDFTFVNNVLFNYRHRTIDGGDHLSRFNIINNYFKPGPGTPRGDVAFRLLKPESERSKTVVDNFGRAYVAGNVVEGHDRVTRDNWDGGVQPESRGPRESVLAKIRLATPVKHAPLEISSAVEAFHHVLANVGATLPRRDPVDERIVNMVRTGQVPPAEIAKGSVEKAKFYGYADKFTAKLADLVKQGFITDPSEVGGYPEYKGTPYADADSDGLPDAWETSHGLDPKDPRDATKDLNGDGYTNIEDFINGLDPRGPKIDWTDLKHNVDRRNHLPRA